MALATGVEAPSSAIAQLGQLDDAGRRRFGRVTLWLTLAIVGSITLALTAEAVHLRIGIPRRGQHPDRRPRRAARLPVRCTACSSWRPPCSCSRPPSSSFQAGPGPAQGPGPPTRRTAATGGRHPAHGVGYDEPAPHAVLGCPGFPGRLLRGDRRRRRPGPATGAVLCRLGLHVVPGRPARDGRVQRPRPETGRTWPSTWSAPSRSPSRWPSTSPAASRSPRWPPPSSWRRFSTGCGSAPGDPAGSATWPPRPSAPSQPATDRARLASRDG